MYYYINTLVPSFWLELPHRCYRQTRCPCSFSSFSSEAWLLASRTCWQTCGSVGPLFGHPHLAARHRCRSGRKLRDLWCFRICMKAMHKLLHVHACILKLFDMTTLLRVATRICMQVRALKKYSPVALALPS